MSSSAGRPTRRNAVGLAIAALVLAGCGPSDGASVEPAAPAPSSAPVTVRSETAAPPITRIDEPATATTPADRLEDGVHITWIGGSDIDHDGRSIPAAVMARSPMIGDRPLVVFGDTKIAPLPAEVETRVEQAAARNVDGLVVILNPSWLSWDGHDACAGIMPAHDYYACVLEPLPGTDVSALRDDVSNLVDTIVDTGIPAYLYVIPHSAESLAHPELGPRLEDTEAQFADLDPGVKRVEYIGHIFSRDLEPLREGVEFNDMVHPSEFGVEVLADHFIAEFVRFFGPLITRD